VMDAIQTYVDDLYGDVATFLADGLTINPTTINKMAWNSGEGLWEVARLLGVRTQTITHTNTDDDFPNQISPVLVGNTLRPKTRGRKFLMGFVESMADGSDLTSTALTALGNALSDYLADENISAGNDLSPGVYREGVDDFEEFTDGSVNSVVGTQRRRKPGVGA
jgi:hypothetical protein